MYAEIAVHFICHTIIFFHVFHVEQTGRFFVSSYQYDILVNYIMFSSRVSKHNLQAKQVLATQAILLCPIKTSYSE